MHYRCGHITAATSMVALGEQRQPRDNPGSGLGETRRDFGRNRPPVRPTDAAGLWRWAKERLGPVGRSSLKPCERGRRKRKRRQGLSAAFIVNRGAGRVCNRPGNSAGATLFQTVGKQE
jgi:hypothetical protein